MDSTALNQMFSVTFSAAVKTVGQIQHVRLRR